MSSRKSFGTKRSCSSLPSPKQTSLVSYFGTNQATGTNHHDNNSTNNSSKKPKHSLSTQRYISNVRDIVSSSSSSTTTSSAFGMCPICENRIPIHRLALHASECEGRIIHNKDITLPPSQYLVQKDTNTKLNSTKSTGTGTGTTGKLIEGKTVVSESDEKTKPDREPIPGLFIYDDFLSEQEENDILLQLDDTTTCSNHDDEGYGLSWKAATFNGTHYGQRWGVHCNLRTRQVFSEDRSLPKFYSNILFPKINTNISSNILKGCVPNEMNAIDYRKSLGHSLSSHVDDRHLSKEVIINISLAGDCFMTFTPVQKPRASTDSGGSGSTISSTISATTTTTDPIRVLLKRRCLQILSGPARYQYSHGIANQHLLNERRVSLTLRESPITTKKVSNVLKAAPTIQPVGIPHKAPTSTRQDPPTIPSKLPSWITPRLQKSNANDLSVSIQDNVLPSNVQMTDLPPGLFLFPNFITEEEENEIIQKLDNTTILPYWSTERHSGIHREKRWGVDHDLWSRQVRPPKYNIPKWIETMIIERIRQLHTTIPMTHDSNHDHNNNDEQLKKLYTMLQLFIPNDVNAIEYIRDSGHSLLAHIDDRQKHTEPIANLSLVGDCYMTYTIDPNKKLNADDAPSKKKKKTMSSSISKCDDVDATENKTSNGDTVIKDVYHVFLPRRTLQILTGRSRYDYKHGIQNSDLCSERRVSITLRETKP
jgi:alkylated DNA repair dioxygenase AlkB